MSEPKMKFGKGTPLSEIKKRRKVSAAESASRRISAAKSEAARKTAEGRERKLKKREEKKRERRPGEEQAPLRKPVKPSNSRDVEKWWREALREMFGHGILVPDWPQKSEQQKMALKLLSLYGADLTKRAIMLFCQTWEKRVEQSRDRLPEVPSFFLFWGMREQVFIEAQIEDRPKKPKEFGKDSDEYREDNTDPSIGWG